MTSYERINEYSKLDVEPLDTGKVKPPADWPSEGEITFDNVSFSYDPKNKLPNVLNELTFTIRAGEKVGIIGRTGAGKSSIIQTLFRMSEPDGQILIDNVDTKELSLHDLRSKIAIIPQEPIIFTGTIRSNLDPYNVYDDKTIWHSLEQVQLKDVIKSMDGGLDASILKNGSNLSLGQRQLMCLARAILKNSKIIVIDEATANVDYKYKHISIFNISI